MLGGLIMLLVTAYLARSLGAEVFGNFSYVISFVFFFVILSNLGIDIILTRELSKSEPDEQALINTTLSLKTVLSLASIGIVVILAYVIDFSDDIRISLIIRSFVLLFMAFTQTFSAIYQSRIKLWIPAVGNFLNKFFFLIIILIVLSFSKSLPLIIAATAIPFIIECFLLWFYLRETLHLRFGFNRVIVKDLIKESIPLALSTTFYTVYLRVDVIMLDYFKSASAVGFYSAAYHLAEALNMFPGAFMTTVFPLLSKYKEMDMEKFRLTLRLCMKFLFSIIFPMIVGVVLLKEGIISLFYGAGYAASAPALGVLIFSTGFIFLSVVLTKIIIIEKKTMLVAWVALAGALFNFLLNFYFIPKWGIVGASYTTMMTEGLIAFIWFYYVYVKEKHVALPSFLFFVKIGLATAIMGIAVHYTPGIILFPILVGLIVYILLAVVLRLFSSMEQGLIKELFPSMSKIFNRMKD